eukprot:TRINITY_DN11925_c0_g1_i1.p1 TRINITY_DN11925_c0_g1~~TRINITY_DN11925_c0_g1_i1.p1  ORF type:complete len:148 (-),score=38.44 TRINITY_DN11925_c0_g1_i1:169-612(-)
MVERLSEQQVAEFKEAFALFDKTNSGTIAHDQLGVVMRSLGTNPTNAEVRDMLAEIGNKKIDFQLFLQYMARKLQDMGNMHDELIDAFKVFDKAGTGFVSLSDIKHVIVVLGESLSKEEADQMLKDAETDGSGRINYTQFAKILCAN